MYREPPVNVGKTLILVLKRMS